MSSKQDTRSVLLAISEGVAHLTLNRPEAMNTYDPPMVAQLAEALAEVDARAEVRALVLSGAGPAFCGGADVKLIAGIDQRQLQAHALGFVTDLHAVLLALHRVRVPSLCAINGACAGGAIGMALACDLSWASESATFTTAFTAIGLTPDTGTSYLLPRAVGERAARDLLLSNRRVGAQEALRIGLVSRVVPDPALIEEALALARKLAGGPTSTLVRMRALIDRGARQDLKAQLATEHEEVMRCIESGDLAEGVAAFVERRRPLFGR